MPKDVINSILDRVVDTDDLVEKVVDSSVGANRALRRALRGMVARADGDAEGTREAFREVFRQVMLATFATHLPDALRVVRSAVVAEARAVKALGSHRLREIQPLRKPDVMRRRAEREGLVKPGAGEAAGG